MQLAIWNGKRIYAREVAEDYFLEKEVRRASANKEIRCAQKDCPHPALRYCNGDKKEPYFAHLDASDCDFSRFERNFGVMESLTIRLAQILEKNGYEVVMHERLFPGHITYLMAGKLGETPVAIDFITHMKGVEDIDGWAKSYRENNIPYTFIVADRKLDITSERNTFFAKRYSLNETTHNYLVIIDWEGKAVSQTAIDRNEYNYKGRNCPFPEWMGVYYMESKNADVLVLEGIQITIPGFTNRFETWLYNKEQFYENWKKKVDEQEEIERLRREKEARRVAERKKEQERLAEQKRLEEEQRRKDVEKARAKAEHERKERVIEEAKQRAMNHPKLSAVYTILSGCSYVSGTFQFKDSSGYQCRTRNLEIKNIDMDIRHSRIVLNLPNWTQAYIFVNGNGEGDQTERSGALFMNVNLNNVDVEQTEEKLKEYITFS